MQRFRSQSRLAICKPASLQIPILLVLICFLNVSLVCSAAVITVPQDYSTIQSAIDAAFDGDEIIVSPSTYYENINFLGKNIILRSTDPTSPTIVASTIIDASTSGSVVTFSGTELTTCVLSGFTITNGYASDGGGIYGNGTQANIQYNKIIANTAARFWSYGKGGGVFDCDGIIENNTISRNQAEGDLSRGGGLYFCDGTIRGNIISENSAYQGGGLYKCDGTIQKNIISGNRGRDRGGGLYLCDGAIQNNIISYNSATGNYASGGGLLGCNGAIQNNIISYNSATGIYTYGGGLYNCYGAIQNNIISYNSATGNYASGGGLFLCNGPVVNNTIFGNWASGSNSSGGGLSECRISSIINCIIWQNAALSGAQLYLSSTPSYSCIQDWTGGGTENTYFDPALVNPEGGDFHLHSVSPCIDAGRSVTDLSQDFENDPRPYDALSWETRGDGSDFDIGADEFIGTTPPDYPPEKPMNISPPNGATGISLAPTLRSSPFSDTNPGEPHFASQWQLDDNADFSSPIFERGLDKVNKTSITLTPTRLTTLTKYYWRVRHMDNRGTWSEWSNATHFTTKPPGIFTVPDDYVSIQEAINAVIDGDEIIVSPGAYYENINFNGKNIILRSTHPTDSGVVESTIINGNRAGSVVTFSGTENETCVLSGFTITRGYTLNGGGIYGNGTRATIENNTIVRNSASGDSDSGDGGGLHDCDGVIRNNVISENKAQVSDGYSDWSPYAYSWEEHVYRHLGDGGGLYDCDGTIVNNIISNNIANNGGGLYGCDGIIQNNTIFGNRANGYWWYRWCYLTTRIPYVYWCDDTVYHYTGAGGGIARSSPGTIIRNCIIWENEAYYIHELSYNQPAFYCAIQGWTGGGTGNIASDPEFVDSENGDFHLQPSSPCIDAGGTVILAQDFEGNPRPWDGTSELRGDGSDFDIGADEFIGSITYDFIDSEEGWTPGSAIIFSLPQYLREAGSLKIISQDNTNTFGFWNSPENAIPVTKGYLYRARFIVSTDVAQPELVPQIRLRVNSRNFQQADCLIIDSSGDGGASPTPDGKTYDLYFVPPANAYFCMLSFDLLNFNESDAPDGSVALDSVLVERFRLDTLDESTTITWTYDFETSQDFCFPGDGTVTFTDPEFFWAEGALYLQSMTNSNTFGYWGSDPTDITIEANSLYRGTFEVRTDEPERSRVPQMRLRFNTANMQVSRSLEIASFGDGANSPSTTNTTYARLYFLPPVNCVGSSLIVSFDILNFNPGDAPTASLILDRAIIETLSPPALP
ncbi:hypothetical protein ES707_11854 [subsurface metagenome]